MIKTDVKTFVWKPLYSGKADESRCRHRVSGHGRYGSHQCSRKAVETIQGYGFCTQHAEKVKGALGIAKSSSGAMIYITKFSRGRASLACAKLVKETPKRYTISMETKKNILGSVFCSRFIAKGRDAHTSLDSALDYLQERLQQYADSCRQELETAEEQLLNFVGEREKIK